MTRASSYVDVDPCGVRAIGVMGPAKAHCRQRVRGCAKAVTQSSHTGAVGQLPHTQQRLGQRNDKSGIRSSCRFAQLSGVLKAGGSVRDVIGPIY